MPRERLLDARLQPFLLRVEHDEAVAVVLEPVVEVRAVGERVVHEDEAATLGAQVHLDAECGIERVERGRLVHPVGADQGHSDLRSERLKSTVRLMNLRLAAKSVFQLEVPNLRGAKITGKRRTTNPSSRAL